MEIVYRPYVDPQLESLIERLHPPRVCVDNDSFEDCTLVKVDSANKHGILLEMVQDLTDLDLVISKSYISSDGGWLMDVFHVTDQLGHKLTDQSLIFYIQEILCARRREGFTAETRSCIRGELKPFALGSEQTALEMTGTDRPGLISEILAVLVELGCNVTAAVAWTHNGRVASIIYLEDGFGGGPIRDPKRLAYVEEQLENVLEAHHGEDEKKRLRLIAPAAGRTHTERRLHQLMRDDGDYERCGGYGRTQVEIESCKEREYSVVNITCRDRPKLLFDTVCALTDMHYVVFHAAVSSTFSIANQEYFVRHKDGCAMDTESEREKLKLCLIAAIERRVSHGLRLDLCTQKRMGLLSDITRVFRENGLSISRIEIGINGEKAVGSFHVTDASGNEVNLCAVEAVIEEIGGSAIAVHKPSKWVASPPPLPPLKRKQSSDISDVEEKPRLSSLASLLWSQLERFSHTVLGH